MGTSTNLLVNSIALKSGVDKFSFFEFSLYGLIFLGIGIVVMTIGSRFLPQKVSTDLQRDYDIENYIFTVKIPSSSDILGKTLAEVDLISENLATPLKLIRDNKVINAPGKYVDIKEGDNLVLMSSFACVNKFVQDHNLIMNERRREAQSKDFGDGDSNDVSDMTYVELLVLPGSHLIGHTLKRLRNMSLNGAYPIAIKKRRNIRNTKERLIRKAIKEIKIKPGDRILVELQEQHIGKIYALENIAVLSQQEYKPAVPFKRKISALVILLFVIVLAASGVLSILAASLSGVGAMLLFRLITLENIYHRINWQIIVLLAGMIPLGIAMTNSGADVWISDRLLEILEGKPPMIVIGLLFGTTILLSGFISNNATAIVMTPIAIAIAIGFNLDVKPFVLAVLFGANFSFFTPVGYQTNTLIYGTGIYEFKHFAVIGGLLSFILWITGTIVLTNAL